MHMVQESWSGPLEVVEGEGLAQAGESGIVAVPGK